MNRTALIAAALVMVGNSFVWADVPAPPPKREERVVAPVSIVRGAIRGEGRSVQAKIRIPKHLVHGGGFGAPAAEPVPPPGRVPPRGIEPPAPRAEDRSSLPPFGTIVAGLAMSLAAVSVVFVARGNRTGKTVAMAIFAGAVVLGVYGAATADLIVPGRGPRPAPPEIVIELVDEGDEVTLFLSR